MMSFIIQITVGYNKFIKKYKQCNFLGVINNQAEWDKYTHRQTDGYCDYWNELAFWPIQEKLKLKTILVNTRRYGPLRGPTSSSCGGLWPSAEAFFALHAVIMLFWPIFGNFWCPVVTLVTLSSNICIFERNHKNPKKNKKRKSTKKSENLKKSKKI